MKESQELHFFTIEIHGKKLVRNINLPARFRGAELFMGQFRTIYILLAGFVSLFVIAFFLQWFYYGSLYCWIFRCLCFSNDPSYFCI